MSSTLNSSSVCVLTFWQYVFSKKKRQYHIGDSIEKCAYCLWISLFPSEMVRRILCYSSLMQEFAQDFGRKMEELLITYTIPSTLNSSSVCILTFSQEELIPHRGFHTKMRLLSVDISFLSEMVRRIVCYSSLMQEFARDLGEKMEEVLN
ncbi:hypothetical protein CEXT_37821 [Caerostris extrusa]|uniref:Uncharacterized protein n=1 Tax=Caerostris extrusa TaxID=172846 RepID=A0AAV4XFW6_CAEEX|nr:hypothetical protein CEXT_37821 [Caerostris extrusa]